MIQNRGVAWRFQDFTIQKAYKHLRDKKLIAPCYGVLFGKAKASPSSSEQSIARFLFQGRLSTLGRVRRRSSCN
ncbi:hypothetical protein Ancab_025428 [Ancistrocladus abbreviatus]